MSFKNQFSGIFGKLSAKYNKFTVNGYLVSEMKYARHLTEKAVRKVMKGKLEIPEEIFITKVGRGDYSDGGYYRNIFLTTEGKIEDEGVSYTTTDVIDERNRSDHNFNISRRGTMSEAENNSIIRKLEDLLGLKPFRTWPGIKYSMLEKMFKKIIYSG